jgi:hypothetical protein
MNNTITPQVVAYKSPISVLIGDAREINYHPLSSVENASLKLDDTERIDIWDYLSFMIDNLEKLSTEIRSVLIEVIDPQISSVKPLEIPFKLANDSIAVEIFRGKSRFLGYKDLKTDSLFRFFPIPYNETDPEIYVIGRLKDGVK